MGHHTYTYKWTTEPYITEFHPELFNVYCSDWLSDTTIANPQMYIPYDGMDEKEFYLEVTDSSGNVATDTIVVAACGHGSVPLGNIPIFPTVGDTVTLHFYTSFTCAIDSIRWDPSPNIVSSGDSLTIEVWIDDTNFRMSDLSVTCYNKYGCEVALYSWEIIPGIYPLGIAKKQENGLKLWPNPSSGLIHVQAGSPIQKMVVTNLHGEVMHVTYPGTDYTVLDPGLPSGMYFLQVETGNGEVRNRKIVVRR